MMLVVPGYLSAEFVVDLWTLMVEPVHWEKSFVVLRQEECLYLARSLQLAEDLLDSVF